MSDSDSALQGPHPQLRARQLVADMAAAGLLDDPAWREAFTVIPRHHFLPRIYPAAGDPGHAPPPISEADRRQLAYRDVTWVVRLTGPRSQPGQPASSSIQPSLAARMLHELAITGTGNILEIGTGTGYLTALLCHRVGADNITSIDIDPELLHTAAALLTELGHRPRLATADGAHGYPANAPYDRILATAAVEKAPPAWINQTRPGGRIVTPLRSAIAVIDVHDRDHATGRFLPTPARVLPLRVHAQTPPAQPAPALPSGRLPDHPPLPAGALHDHNFRFLLDLALPGIEYHDQGALGALTIRHPDGSTAQIGPAGQTRQHGPRQLVDEIAAAHQSWRAAGNPGPDRFRLTIDPHRQTVWLDDPQTHSQWKL
jgi:protein-L-isoaspartate O-methyltransferase